MGLAPQQAAPRGGAAPPISLNANTSTSAAGIAALRASEGQRDGGRAYNDAANNCTRGVGILVHAGACTAAELAQAPDSQANETSFQMRLHAAEASVRRQVSGRALTQDQFDALVSATFNLGSGGVAPVARAANQGDDATVQRELRARIFLQPRNARGLPSGPPVRSQGLANRREREAHPFAPMEPQR